MRKNMCRLALCVTPFFCQAALARPVDSTGTGNLPVDISAPVPEEHIFPPVLPGDQPQEHLRLPLAARTISMKSFVAPVSMIAYGALTLRAAPLKKINLFVRDEVWEDRNEHGNAKKIHLDDYSIFVPAVAVYGLNLAGIKGRHNFAERTILYGMSSLIANGLVFSSKSLTNVIRPDSSNAVSFPSGHTAEAFVSAEFLRQEYKDVSPWYGVAGYAVAAGTGFLRMYNNKHWFNDVVAGAGVGILSVRFSYWLYPKLKSFVLRNPDSKTIVMPTYQSGAVGLGLVHAF